MPSWNRQRRQLCAGLSALALGMNTAKAQSPLWKLGDAVQLPPLELLDGSMVDWSSYKGKVVVLEFWGSWCPFCARQNPLLDRLYKEHQSKGLEVITISLDKTKEAASAYMKKGGYAFRAGLATPPWHAIYRQRKGLPQLFVLDRSGRLVLAEVREMMEEDLRDIAKFL